jgi:hypothetical protein
VKRLTRTERERLLETLRDRDPGAYERLVYLRQWAPQKYRQALERLRKPAGEQPE